MKKICIIKAGTAPEKIRTQLGDFEDYIIDTAGISRSMAEVFPVYDDHKLPEVNDFDGVVITGSYSMVTDNLDWSVDAERWLRKIALEKIPILGICYGHQLIAHAFGGTVAFHPKGKEIGMVEIKLTKSGKKDPLLQVLPAQFFALVNHFQTVELLPQDAIALANNKFESHHAIAFGENIWGVQFHPEFSREYMQLYLELNQKSLIKEGWNWDSLYNAVQENVCGGILLKRFIELL